MSDSSKRTHPDEIASFTTATEHHAVSPPLLDEEKYKTQDTFAADSSECGKTGLFQSSKQKFRESRSSLKSRVVPFQNVKYQDGDKGIVITRIFDRNRFSHSTKPLGSYVSIPLPPGCIPSEIMVPAGEVESHVTFRVTNTT